MKIAASNIIMASSSTASSSREVRESLRVWVGGTRPDFEGDGLARASAPSVQVSLSDAGKAAQSAEMQAIHDVDEAVENDPRMRMIRMLVEFLTGKRVSLLQAEDFAPSAENAPATVAAGAAAGPPPRAGFGVEYDYHESYSESAAMAFAATGVIRTEDGQEIAFELSLTMQRQYAEEINISVREGDARKVDPLILNFAGTAAQLSDQKFSFDLDADGNKEDISYIQGGGFLALDRNGDGKINDGRELFGPATGNGFAELQALDDDGNGWIDENDAAYSQLRIWTVGSDDGRLATLKQANVGALYLGNVASPFDMKDGQNQLQGQVRSSGLWVSESGQVGSMQQIDLVA